MYNLIQSFVHLRNLIIYLLSTLALEINFKNIIYSLILKNIMKLSKHKKRRLLAMRYIAMVLFAILQVQSLKAQTTNITISGKVIDETGLVLPGVNVVEKGTQNGTITDLKGGFSLKTKNNGTIIFSYIGYETKEIRTSELKNVTIALTPESKSLSDVVVIGYGSVKKKDITGAVSSVDITDIQKAPVKSFDEALAGRVAGVVVSSVDGQPGEAPNIVIRGNSSLTQDNTPLYVIDGLPIENINSNAINPSDIESMEVLKDASATAIYGSLGANGVIIITTKKGKAGKPIISVEYNVGQAQNTKSQTLLSPYEFVKLNYAKDPLKTTEYYLANGKTIDSYQGQNSLDWENQLLQNANYNNLNMSLRGESGGTNYSLTGSYTNQDGIIINSGFKRYQGRISISQKINSKLKLSTNINYANTNSFGTVSRDYNTGSTAGNPTTALMSDVWTYRPTTGTGNIDLLDNGLDPTINPILDYRYNPIKTVKNSINTNIQNSLVAVADLDYSILKNLVLKISGSLNKNDRQIDLFYNSNTRFGDRRTPQGVNGANGSINNTENTILNAEATLTYKKKWNNNNLTLLAGATDQSTTILLDGFSANNVPNESLGVYGLSQGVLMASTSYASANMLNSYFGRAIYDYKSKYYLTASYRADGSSKFSTLNKWGYFPSAALSWRITSEKFMKRISFISDAKFRLSYGLTGNNRVPDFSYLATTQVLNGYYSFGSTLVPGAFRSSLNNPELKWETTAQTNIGLDLQLFKGRIGLVIDYYNKLTKDLLLNTSMPGSTGFNSAIVNIGQVQNSGFEFTINTTNIKTKKFSWTSNFNISFNRNKILDLAFGQDALITSANNTNPSYISRIGSPMGQMYGYVFDGLYQNNDFIVNNNGTYTLKNEIAGNGGTRSAILPGNIRYKDLNGDGNIDSKDQTIIGNGYPLHTGGLSNNFTFMNFDLNVFFQWSYGNDILNANRMYLENLNYPFGYNQFATAALDNRWSQDNQTSLMPIVTGNNGINTSFSSRLIEDGSFLRLKTIRFGYTIPTKWLNGTGVSSINIFASAQNIFTWTKYSGVDPEVSTNNSPLSPGYDYSAYPKARTIAFGIKLTL